MKLIPALISTTLLFSAIPSFSAANGKTPAAAAQRRSSTTKSKRKRTPVPPAATSLIQTLPSGLSFIVTRRGQGRQPRAGEKVSVNYTGVMANGIKFDSSLDRGRPFAFVLGAGGVIKGWDEGVAKLRVGDQATLIIPPQLGYGAEGRGPIPPNATLIFIIELMGIEETPPAN
jgi:peptidylprolyl isomerase